MMCCRLRTEGDRFQSVIIIQYYNGLLSIIDCDSSIYKNIYSRKSIKTWIFLGQFNSCPHCETQNPFDPCCIVWYSIL